VVYGPAYEELKLNFISELHSVIGGWPGPTLLGGDFNLVRSQKEKSNEVINFQHVNDFINHWGLVELKDPTRSFTWSNNQETPILAVLDRILASVEWESKFSLSKVKVLPKGCSDHNPLLIDFGGENDS
jgi:endonuclease/exonuclease/phosphatase (EEP) superfamily protein YafD